MAGEAFLVQLHRHLAIKLYYAEIWTALNKVNPEEEGRNKGEGGGGRLESPTSFAKSFLVPQFFPQPNQIVASPDAKHLDFDLWQQPAIFIRKRKWEWNGQTPRKPASSTTRQALTLTPPPPLLFHPCRLSCDSNSFLINVAGPHSRLFVVVFTFTDICCCCCCCFHFY